MAPLRRTIARAMTALLPALSLAVTPAAPALADAVYRYDDGTMETALHHDASDGADYAGVTFEHPEYLRNGADSVTLWVYGRAAECSVPGGRHEISVGMFFDSSFDPCAVFPTATYGWASFPIRLANLGYGLTHVSIRDSDQPSDGSLLDPATGHNAYYAIDTRRDRQSTVRHVDATGTHDVAGELMWYLVADGSHPYMYSTPPHLYFPMHEPGTTGATLTVTVTSAGTEPLQPAVTMAGSGAADFTIGPDGCTGQTLQPDTTCTVSITHTRQTGGFSEAEVVVTAPGTDPERVTATAWVRPAPPVSAFTTANGATLAPGERVAGTVAGEGPVAYETVTFDPRAPRQATVTSSVEVSCDASGTTCTWSAAPLLPGTYDVTAFGTDILGKAGPPAGPIAVTIVAG